MHYGTQQQPILTDIKQFKGVKVELTAVLSLLIRENKQKICINTLQSSQ